MPLVYSQQQMLGFLQIWISGRACFNKIGLCLLGSGSSSWKVAPSPTSMCPASPAYCPSHENYRQVSSYNPRPLAPHS